MVEKFHYYLIEKQKNEDRKFEKSMEVIFM